MCSSGGDIAKNDEALQQSQIAMNNTLNTDYSTTFKESQLVLAQQKARLDAMIANPLGYSQQELHTQKANINDQVSTAAKNAFGKAAAFAAAHGAADVSGGGAAQMGGEIASDLAGTKAKMLADLSNQNEALKRQNFNTALEGLNSLGSEYSGAGGTAISGANAAAGTSIEAGSGALAAKQAGWQNFSGVLGGISGLASAAAGTGGIKGICWIAAEVYGGWDEPRTNIVREWMVDVWAKESRTGAIVTHLYRVVGRHVAWFVHRSVILRSGFKILFDIALVRAGEKRGR